MKIIDKNKDYYDYLSNIYGIDDNITFDRRGSVILTNDSINQFIDDNMSPFVVNLLLLEAGYIHYVFKIEYGKENKYTLIHTFEDEVHFSDYPLSLYFTREFHFFNSFFIRKHDWNAHKLTYKNVVFKNYSKWNKKGKDGPLFIDLPILDKTFVPSIIKQEEIWKNIYNYICKINEPKIIDKRDDVAKAEDHGFDKKTSFRHPVK